MVRKDAEKDRIWTIAAAVGGSVAVALGVLLYRRWASGDDNLIEDIPSRRPPKTTSPPLEKKSALTDAKLMRLLSDSLNIILMSGSLAGANEKRILKYLHGIEPKQYSSSTRLTAARWLSTYYIFCVINATSEREHSDVVSLGSKYNDRIFQLLEFDVSELNPKDSIVYHMFKMDLFKNMHDSEGLSEEFSAMQRYVNKASELPEDVVISCFQNAAFLGRWGDFIRFGTKLSKDRLESFHDLSAGEGQCPDFGVLIDILQKQPLEELRPSDLVWKQYQFVNCKVRSKASEDEAAGDWIDIEAMEDHFVIMMGGVVLMTSCGDVTMRLIGPLETSRIFAKGYLEVALDKGKTIRRTDCFDLHQDKEDVSLWAGDYSYYEEPSSGNGRLTVLDITMRFNEVPFDQ